MTNKSAQWIVGLNAVASALEHDAEHVREVLLEAGGKNPRIVELEGNARRLGIDVRRVAQQALDGVAGGLRHQGAAARYAAAKPGTSMNCRRWSAAEGRRCSSSSMACRTRTTSAPACACGRRGRDRGAVPQGQGGAGQRDRAQDFGRRRGHAAGVQRDQSFAHAARTAETSACGSTGSPAKRRPRCTRSTCARQRRAGAGQRGRGPAPAHPRELRPAGEDPDAGRVRKPQRLGRHRHRPVRGGAATGGIA